jgi:hypothetical protein
MGAIVGAAERATLASDGFVIIKGPVVTSSQLSEVRALLDPLFDRFSDFPDNFAHDLGAKRAVQTASIPELEYVTSLVPALKRTKVFAAFRDVARDLMNNRVQLTFDHAIYKPAGSTAITPWHQDSGYDRSGRKLLTVWIPMQDTDESNGCMRYIPGSHLGGPLQHQDLEGRHGRSPVVEVDEHQIRLAEVPAGGAVIHQEHTLHSAGPNPASDVRRSLILQFARPMGPDDRLRLSYTRWQVKRMCRRTISAH